MNEQKKLLADEHPRLFHYTSAAGLEGILRTQTLRATHYAYLNDAQEIRHFLERRLPETLGEIFLPYRKNADDAFKLGKTYANGLSAPLLNSHDGRGPLAEPFISSFCTPKDDDSRVEEHGLLSQWRGYGKDGGYALVFDTAGLSDLLTEYWKQYQAGGDLFFGDVIYSCATYQAFSTEFADDLHTIRTHLLNELSGIRDEVNLSKLYIALMRCACRYKHWGFKEENEVRIILIPHDKETGEFAKAEGIEVDEIPRAEYIRAGTGVPYVDILRGVTSPKRPLPIRRIIVGPCAEYDRARRIRAVEILLAQHHIDAKVTASEIPFIG